MTTDWNPGDAPAWCRLSGELPRTNGNVVVIVDDSPDHISAFFEAEVPSLPDTVEARLLKLPAIPEPETTISLLREALASLVPEIGPEFSPLSPGKWVPEIKKRRAVSPIRDRWILIDGFHHVLNAPGPERRLFVDVLLQLARVPSFGVIAGITTESAMHTATLLNLIDGEGNISPSAGAEDWRPRFGRWAAAACLVLGLAATTVFLHTRVQREEIASQLRDLGGIYAYSDPLSEGTRGLPFPPVSTLGKELKSFEDPLPPAVIQPIDPAGSTDPEENSFRAPTSPGAAADFDVAHLRKRWNFSPEDNVSENDVLYFVAEAYCFGHGVEQDLDHGIALLQNANEKGSEKAANLLATCYSRGFGVERDYEQARSLYEIAAERGSAHAPGNLGVLHLRGLGCSQSSERALEHFVNGARHGDPFAAFFAARCFETGIGSPGGKEDRDQAVYFYLEAAKNGHEEATEWCRARNLLPEEKSS